MPTTDEILEKVRDILVDALGADAEDVTPDARLMADLDAESIDMLDIVFRLEKGFNIKIPRGELVPENLAAADSSFIQNGVVTPAGIAELKKRMPHADVDAFAADPRVEKIQDLLTVNMLVRFLETKLGRQ